jgi:hypothetical protein
MPGGCRKTDQSFPAISGEHLLGHDYKYFDNFTTTGPKRKKKDVLES